MPEITQRSVDANGITIHFAECGEGPVVVLLLHGFPESWYSYRHQLTGLAEAGYHAVAPDMRGYGRTVCPTDVASFNHILMVGDAMALLDHLGAARAVVVGHDWGSIVAWYSALLRPDRVRGVASLSVPYFPRGDVHILDALRAAQGEQVYMQYFQAPGVAEKELEYAVRATMRRVLYGASGDAPNMPAPLVVPEGGGFLDIFLEPDELPAWLTEADLDFYTAEFERTGFTGGLNWYRAIPHTWSLMSPWHGAPVLTPALYVAGDKDVVVDFPGLSELIPNLRAVVPNLVETIMLPGCGHWTQQERPAEVTAALTSFIAGL